MPIAELSEGAILVRKERTSLFRNIADCKLAIKCLLSTGNL